MVSYGPGLLVFGGRYSDEVENPRKHRQTSLTCLM